MDGNAADFASAAAVLDGADLLNFRDIVEASSTPILVVSMSGSQSIEYANTAFRQLLGLSELESVGHDWIEFFADERGGTVLRAAQNAIVAMREAREMLWAKCRDGSRACIKLQVSPLRSGTGFATRSVMVMHDMSAERHVQDTLEQQAHFDALTGLANRHLLYARFEEMLDEAQTFRRSFSVVLLDMNDFKRVNDCFGHEIGDELLKCVGERLTEAARVHDMVSRLGGDEFALLLPDTSDGEMRADTIVRIVETIQQPVELKGHILQPSCSVGVSNCPTDGMDREALMRAADRDLYRAKSSRAGRQASPDVRRYLGRWYPWPRFSRRER